MSFVKASNAFCCLAICSLLPILFPSEEEIEPPRMIPSDPCISPRSVMHVQSGLLFRMIFAVSTESTIRVLPRSNLSDCRIVSSTDTISLAQPMIPEPFG